VEELESGEAMTGLAGGTSTDGVDDLHHGTPPEMAGADGRSGGLLWIAVAGSLLLGVAAFALANTVVEQRRTSLEQNAREQAATLADVRSSLISTWLGGFTRLAWRITRSELVQLYVEGRSGEDVNEPAGWLAGQHPFLRQLLGDFVAQHNLVAASLVAPGGDIIIKVGGGPEGPALPDGIEQGADPIVTPFYQITPAGARSLRVFDVVLPVPHPTAEDAAPAMFVMTVPALPAAIDLLSQGGGDSFPPAVLLQPGRSAFFVTAGRLDLVEGAPPGPKPETLIRVPVDGTDWVVEQPLGAEGAALASFQRDTFVVAIMIAVVLSVSFALFCAGVERRRRRERETARRMVAEQATRFRHLFEDLAGAVSDGVGLKDGSGRYVYANAALSKRLGRPAEEIVGRSDDEIQAEGELAGGSCLRMESGARPELPIVSPDRSGMALVIAPGTAVTVTAERSDPTAGSLVQAALAGHLTIDQAVGLLVRAVELRDPFLKGHGDRVAGLADAVGRRLELGERDRRTIELAAKLCQVGKIFIPDAILTKPSRHTADESAIMRTHVDRALDVLGQIDFGLPVTEVLSEMQERLDGSGHPRGLQGSAIGMPGRILGAVDVFCARTAPRAYRDQVSPGQALFYLAGHPERYDQRVVTALVAAVADGHGRLALPAPPQGAVEQTSNAA
jgi:HD-GYP domain-containing protein (c-di-GMP phosphodiesterase class II)